MTRVTASPVMTPVIIGHDSGHYLTGYDTGHLWPWHGSLHHKLWHRSSLAMTRVTVSPVMTPVINGHDSCHCIIGYDTGHYWPWLGSLTAFRVLPLIITSHDSGHCRTSYGTGLHLPWLGSLPHRLCYRSSLVMTRVTSLPVMPLVMTRVPVSSVKSLGFIWHEMGHCLTAYKINHISLDLVTASPVMT